MPDQGQTRDSSLGYLIASGMFVASYRAVPVQPYLGFRGATLKGPGKRFESFGKAFDSGGKFRVGRWRRWRCRFGPLFDQLVGEQQAGK